MKKEAKDTKDTQGRVSLNVVPKVDPTVRETKPAAVITAVGEKKSPAKIEHDLSSSQYYLNRELTWLEFCRRVLHEAQDERTPLLERLKFVAIVSSNLDEFFMKRIGGLKQQVGAGVQDLTVDGRTPQQQIDECCEVVREIEEEKEVLLSRLLKELDSNGVSVLSYDALDDEDKQALRAYYLENIFPLVTPQAVDSAHPFPFISNLSLNLLVTLRNRGEDEALRARVKVPVGSGIPRFLRIGDSRRFVSLEQVMSNNLDLLFPKMEIDACELFHVTRNANSSRDTDQADDLLAMIESEVRGRKFARIVRLVVQKDMDTWRRGMLGAELGLDQNADVFETKGMMAMQDLFQLSALEIPALHDTPHHPIDHPKLIDAPNIFYAIREAGSILLHHPYVSFSTTVERFLKEASRDPKVRAIKMTLYRTSSSTKAIDYLISAAQNGKQVAVVVELKARFDEAANIRWASRLEEVGIHVTYGVMGLKTHCKVILVVRHDYTGLKRYAHIGTGNYHAGTARLYSDLGMLTCDQVVGSDLTELFNYLTTGYTPKRDYQKVLPAPKELKRALLTKIRREVEKHTKKEPGLIQFKLNALEDVDIARALYEASQAGVRIELIVRDSCRLRPGIEGLSDNIRVISIVGRFLEHSRIYYFRNGGDEEYYIGSADAMKRNLEHRVEVVAPVEDTLSRQELRKILDVYLADQRNAWEMQPNGDYRQFKPKDEGVKGSQSLLIEYAEARLKGVRRLKKRKPQGIGHRNVPRPE
ncbi:MAG: polyphosphate kinase 1 [Gammaproteobacteria bacterium]|nr:polyphosphate kinase 1 [Gammaproteobacteria bacterium]